MVSLNNLVEERLVLDYIVTKVSKEIDLIEQTKVLFKFLFFCINFYIYFFLEFK